MSSDSAPIVHLDTNSIVAIVDIQQPLAETGIEWLAQGTAMHTSAMAWAEFQCGAAGGLSPQDDESARNFITAILPVDERISEFAARLYNATGRRSRRLADCIIAATAILADAPLATANEDDFAFFVDHGLRLAN